MDGRIVLVVDDDPLVREVVARAISDAGYRVLTAGDGEEALAVAGTLDGQLELVVTDIRMPVMDGIELAAQLTGIHPRLPVLFISGYVPEPRADKLPGPLLAKPFTHDQLLSHVRQLVDAKGGASLSA